MRVSPASGVFPFPNVALVAGMHPNEVRVDWRRRGFCIGLPQHAHEAQPGSGVLHTHVS